MHEIPLVMIKINFKSSEFPFVFFQIDVDRAKEVIRIGEGTKKLQQNEIRLFKTRGAWKGSSDSDLRLSALKLTSLGFSNFLTDEREYRKT